MSVWVVYGECIPGVGQEYRNSIDSVQILLGWSTPTVSREGVMRLLPPAVRISLLGYFDESGRRNREDAMTPRTIIRIRHGGQVWVYSFRMTFCRLPFFEYCSNPNSSLSISP